MISEIGLGEYREGTVRSGTLLLLIFSGQSGRSPMGMWELKECSIRQNDNRENFI